MDSIRKALGAEADQLLRLLVRHLPRPGLRHPASRRTGCAGWCSTANVDHRGVWYQANLDQDVAFRTQHRDVLRLAGQARRRLPPRQLRRRRREAVLRRAGQAPGQPGAAARSARTSGPTSSCRPGYYVFGWEKVAVDVREVGARRATPAALRGALRRHRPRCGDDNGYAIYLGRPVHRRALAAAVGSGGARTTGGCTARAPFETWGNAWYNAPCRTGRRARARRSTVDGRAGPPVLLISETLDAATPFAGSLEVRRAVPAVGADRGRRRHHARRLAVRGGVHRRPDRRVPGQRHAARPGGGRPLGQAVPGGAAADPEVALGWSSSGRSWRTSVRERYEEGS